MLEFLLSDEQELFRRAQVRQVLLYLREYDGQRFAEEVRAVLGDVRPRCHVQDSVFFILRGIEDPSRGELDLMLELLAPESRWSRRAAEAVQTPGWFAALDAAGVIETWLTSIDRALEGRAIMAMGADVPAQSARIAMLLAPHTGHPDYFHWLRWVVRRSDGRPSRELFDLLLAAVRSGLFDDQADELFMLTHRLGDANPEWGVRLLAAFWFAERPGALDMESGQVMSLKKSDYGLLELISKTAEGAPEAFARMLLPFMQRVMAIAEQGDHLPRVAIGTSPVLCGPRTCTTLTMHSCTTWRGRWATSRPPRSQCRP